MGTHKITDKVMATISRVFEGSDRERTIKNLEAGKTVHIGGLKLRGVKVDKDEGSMAPAPPAPAADSSSKSSSKDSKDK